MSHLVSNADLRLAPLAFLAGAAIALAWNGGRPEDTAPVPARSSPHGWVSWEPPCDLQPWSRSGGQLAPAAVSPWIEGPSAGYPAIHLLPIDEHGNVVQEQSGPGLSLYPPIELHPEGFLPVVGGTSVDTASAHLGRGPIWRSNDGRAIRPDLENGCRRSSPATVAR